MRILMVAQGQSPHILRPLQWVLDNGHHVLFLGDVDPRPGGGRHYQFQLYPRYVGTAKLPRMLGKCLGNKVVAGIQNARLRRICRQYRPDVVHVHWIDRRAWDMTRAGIRPLILTAWGSDINRFARPGHDAKLRDRVALTLRGADLVIADAPDIVVRCCELAGRDVPAELLPLGIDTAAFTRDLSCERSKWRAKLGVEQDAFLFGSMRAWAPLYNHHLVLEAFAESGLASRGCYLLFKVYYPSGNKNGSDYEETIRRRAAELNIASQVRWVDDVSSSQLAEVYATVDAVVNFPEMDGFPVHFLEAAAAGRMIISRRLPAYAWTFAEHFPLYVPSSSSADLAAAMRAAIDILPSPEFGRRVQDASRTVAREFDQRIMSERLMNAYQRVCQVKG